MRIRSRLLLLVLAVLVPALVASAFGLRHLYEEHRASRAAMLRETARALTLALDREMSRREAILHTLAASPSLRRGDLRIFHEYAREVADERDDAIILSDLEGRQLVNTRLPFGAPLPRMLDMERRARERLGNEPALVSDVYLPPAGLGAHSFAVQVPVRRDGRVTQFLTLASFTRQLQGLLEQQRLPRGWHATIVDRQGHVAARSVDPGGFVGRPVQEEGLLERIRASGEGFHEGRTLAGQAATAFFSRSAQTQWTFIVAVPADQLAGAALRTVTLVTTVSLLLIGLGGMSALAVGRRIAHPIERLRRSAEQLGRHEAVQPGASGTDEIDEVQHALVQASSQLREMNAQLERRVAEAMSRYEQSQRALVQAQKLEALGRLTGGIAHDFNNVLQTMTTSLQAASRAAPEHVRELLQRCQRAVARGGDLARQLMVFGRVQDVRAQTIHTGHRLAEAAALLQGALPSNIALRIELAPDAWPLHVDAAQLELALLNFVMNARDAMPGGGTIVLRARNRHLPEGSEEGVAGDFVELSVSDTGEGMSDEVIAHAPEPFFTTKKVGRGSGMGLAQAYGFARQSGGTLHLRSVLGQGTTATLLLPRAADTPDAAAAAPAGAEPAQGQGKVLLVEDDELVRETVCAALLGAGFDVHSAATADEALARIDAGERYGAVLTDVVMPGSMSGIDLARVLRERHPGMAVVVATGYSDRSVDVPGVRGLSKPYDLQQAVEVLNEALRA